MTSKERPVLVYFSGTGMTDRLVNKINIGGAFDTLRIKTGKENIDRPYILITPTYFNGAVPVQIDRFLGHNEPPTSVIGTGNKQWGLDYCGAGVKIASRYHIPLIAKVEQAGHYQEIESILSYFSNNYKMKVAL